MTPTLTPAEARTALRAALPDTIPEERGPRFPAWPWGYHRATREARAARAAADTRREHIERLIALTDARLQGMLLRGWDPRRRDH